MPISIIGCPAKKKKKTLLLGEDLKHKNMLKRKYYTSS